MLDVRQLGAAVDEADGLVGPTMVSFLTQLRQGYLHRRETPFPHSIALIGLRTVRDYVLTAEERRPVRWALDLMVEWRGERHAIEVKLRRDTQTRKRAIEQVVRYLGSLGLDEGWLVMFDLRAKRSWKERLTSTTVKAAGKRVHVVGC